MGRVLEVALSGQSPSVAVDDVAAFVDVEHGFEFAVDGHVHGLRKCRRKVYLDAEILPFRTKWQQPPSQASGVKSKPKKVQSLPKSSHVNSLPSSWACLPVAENRLT